MPSASPTRKKISPHSENQLVSGAPSRSGSLAHVVPANTAGGCRHFGLETEDFVELEPAAAREDRIDIILSAERPPLTPSRRILWTTLPSLD